MHSFTNPRCLSYKYPFSRFFFPSEFYLVGFYLYTLVEKNIRISRIDISTRRRCPCLRGGGLGCETDMHRRRRSYTFERTAGAGCSRPSAPTRQTQRGCSLQHSCSRTDMASATRRRGEKGAAAHVFTARATACMTLPKDACVFVCSGRYVSAGSTNTAAL